MIPCLVVDLVDAGLVPHPFPSKAKAVDDTGGMTPATGDGRVSRRKGWLSPDKTALQRRHDRSTDGASCFYSVFIQ